MHRVLFYKKSLICGGSEKQLLLYAKNVSNYEIFVAAQIIDPAFTDNYVENIIQVTQSKFQKRISTLRKFIKTNNIKYLMSWDFISSIELLIASFGLEAKVIDGSLRAASTKDTKYFYLYMIKFHIFRLIQIPIVSNSLSGLSSFRLSNYKKGYVLPNIIYNRNNKMYTNNDTFKIGMVANMRFKKDFDTFIQGGIKIIETYKNCHFYLVGAGEKFGHYFKKVEKSGKQDHFTFTGHIPDPIELIEKFDICVLLNEKSGEGQSNSILEYMNCAKPVIATDLGGNPELVVDGLNGYLIKERDVSSFVEKLTYLLRNSELRTIMGRNGKELIVKKHNSIMASQYLADIIEKI